MTHRAQAALMRKKVSTLHSFVASWSLEELESLGLEVFGSWAPAPIEWCRVGVCAVIRGLQPVWQRARLLSTQFLFIILPLLPLWSVCLFWNVGRWWHTLSGRRGFASKLAGNLFESGRIPTRGFSVEVLCRPNQGDGLDEGLGVTSKLGNHDF